MVTKMWLTSSCKPLRLSGRGLSLVMVVCSDLMWGCPEMLVNWTPRSSALNEMMGSRGWRVSTPASSLPEWTRPVPQRVPSRTESQVPLAAPLYWFSSLPHFHFFISSWCFLGSSSKLSTFTKILASGSASRSPNLRPVGESPFHCTDSFHHHGVAFQMLRFFSKSFKYMEWT